MQENKKIITAPDLDYTHAFKILLVDFEWTDITDITEAVKKLDGPVTIFLYGSKDDNPEWCIAQAKQCSSTLMNMIHIGNCETLKGFLMREPTVYTLGTHKLDHLFQRKVLDSMSWLAIQYEQWHRINEVKNVNVEA